MITEIQKLSEYSDLGLLYPAKVSVAFISGDNEAVTQMANISLGWTSKCCFACELDHRSWQTSEANSWRTTSKVPQIDYRTHDHVFSPVCNKEVFYGVDIFHNLYESKKYFFIFEHKFFNIMYSIFYYSELIKIFPPYT